MLRQFKNIGSIDIHISSFSWDDNFRQGRMHGVNFTKEMESDLQDKFIGALQSSIGAKSITGHPKSVW
jgi:hypothetical protein